MFNMFSPTEKFDLVNFYFFQVFNLFDYSLTNASFYLIFCMITILCLFANTLLKSYILPRTDHLLIELIWVFVFDVLDKQIGNRGYSFFPFVFLLFLFILISNLYGILPYSFALTSHIVVTFFFSIIVWITAIAVGIYINGINFYKLFVPDVPIYMLPFLILIELTSYIIRVFSLAIRLAANITAGHVLLFTIAGFSVKLIKLNWFAAAFAGLVLVFVFVLELGVAFLQAYVFVTLVCIYLNDSINLSH